MVEKDMTGIKGDFSRGTLQVTSRVQKMPPSRQGHNGIGPAAVWPPVVSLFWDDSSIRSKDRVGGAVLIYTTEHGTANAKRKWKSSLAFPQRLRLTTATCPRRRGTNASGRERPFLPPLPTHLPEPGAAQRRRVPGRPPERREPSWAPRGPSSPFLTGGGGGAPALRLEGLRAPPAVGRAARPRRGATHLTAPVAPRARVGKQMDPLTNKKLGRPGGRTNRKAKRAAGWGGEERGRDIRREAGRGRLCCDWGEGEGSSQLGALRGAGAAAAQSQPRRPPCPASTSSPSRRRWKTAPR